MSAIFKPGLSYLVQKHSSVADLISSTAIADNTQIVSSEVTVKEIRSMLRQIIERPFAEHRLLYIPKADQLSNIIQTTLLKTIEEPPAHLIIILQTDRPEALLHTVRSRLQTIREVIQPIEIVIKTEISELDGADREKALQVLRSVEYETNTEPNVSVQKLEIVASAIQRLRLNCNVKLTIDWFLLRWHALSGTE